MNFELVRALLEGFLFGAISSAALWLFRRDLHPKTGHFSS